MPESDKWTLLKHLNLTKRIFFHTKNIVFKRYNFQFWALPEVQICIFLCANISEMDKLLESLKISSLNLQALNHRSKKNIQIFAYAIFRLQTPINVKICKIVLGHISQNKSYWHDCSLLVNVRVVAKSITDQ